MSNLMQADCRKKTQKLPKFNPKLLRTNFVLSLLVCLPAICILLTNATPVPNLQSVNWANFLAPPIPTPPRSVKVQPIAEDPSNQYDVGMENMAAGGEGMDGQIMGDERQQVRCT